GTWNPRTVEAVRRYQEDRGLAPSGVPGVATARLLRAA
ncbi:peptidoglycan-binding domain-containing protein, partial [Patulibacter sp. S7RM1-6]